MDAFHHSIQSLPDEEIVQKYKPYILAIVRNILSTVASEEDIEECVNDVLFRVIANKNRYDSHEGKEKTFVAVIARNQSLDYYRKLKKRKEVGLDDKIAVKHSDALLTLAIRQVIHRLKKGEQILFTLRYVYGFSPEEIARKLHVSRRNIDTRLSRLRRKMEGLLAEYDIRR